MKRLWASLLRAWVWLRGPKRFAASRSCRLWRLLPPGRQGVHRYVARVEDLEAMSARAHLGMRCWVRTIDRVYQWTPGRRGEVDGMACVYPVDEPPAS